eukprot:2570543-Alexandrium_andersonii.AAC.1
MNVPNGSTGSGLQDNGGRTAAADAGIPADVVAGEVPLVEQSETPPTDAPFPAVRDAGYPSALTPA